MSNTTRARSFAGVHFHWLLFVLALACGEPPAFPEADGGAVELDAGASPPPLDAGPRPVADAGPPPIDAGPPIRRCVGFATPCSLLSSFECDRALGCYSRGECAGFSHSCYGYFSSYSCNSQDGCYWSYLDDRCNGSAWPCDLEGSEFSCIDQEGCSWRDECSGVPLDCAGFTEIDCLDQPGCTLE